MFDDHSNYQEKTETMYLVSEISINAVADPDHRSLEMECGNNSRLLSLKDMLQVEGFRQELAKLGWHESRLQERINEEDVDSLNLGPSIFRIKDVYGKLQADRIDFQTHADGRWTCNDLHCYAIELSEEFVQKFRPDLLSVVKKRRSLRETKDKKAREDREKKLKEAAKLLRDNNIPVGDLGIVE